MEGSCSSSSRTARTGPTEETNERKIKFKPVVRRNVVDNIPSSLKILSFDSDARIQVAEVVEKFEEKTFRNARTKDDYISTIIRRLSSFDRKSGHRTAGVSTSNPGQLPQNTAVAGGGQTMGLNIFCQASSEFAGDSVRQGMQSNISANNQRDIPGIQPSQKVVYQRHQQQELQQFLNQKVRNPNIGSIHVGDIHHQQQQHIASQSSPFCSQNQALPTESRQPPFTEQPGTAVFQQNQLVVQEDNQQLSPFWKSIPNSFRQPVGLQTLSPASLESASASEQANMAELHDQSYRKFRSMKKEYLPLLTYLYNILNEKCQKLPMPVVGKYKKKIIAAEKFIKVLMMPRCNVVQFSMEMLESFQHTLKQFLNSFKQENSVSVQPPGGPSQTSQLQQHINGERKFHPVNLALTSKPVGPSPLSSTQQVVLCSQPNMMNSPCSGSLMDLQQQNATSSLDYAARLEGLDIAGAQQNKFFHDTRVKSFYSATKSLQQNYIMSTSHQQKQLKHQMRQPQNVKQHFQPQLIQQHMRMANALPVTTSVMRQQNPLIGQPSEYSHQMPLPKTPRFQSTYPQMSQHYSAQVDQQNFPLPLSKAGTPLHSTSSSSIKYSPSTPFTPLSIPADYKKHPSGSSSLLIPENSGQPQSLPLTSVDTGNEVLTQSLPLTLPEITASLLCTESACPNENHQSSATKNPLERLIKAVQSLSPKALSASVSEICSATKLVDGIAGTACNNDSEADVDENLHGRNFSSQYGCSFEEKMKRKLHNTSAMAPDASSFSLSESDDLKQSTGQICTLASSETSRNKRRRIEPSNALLDEIKYINQRLLETVLDLDSTEDIAAFDQGEGTIVRCIHNVVALSENFKMQYASQMSVLPLRLLVPASYPNSSPVILGGFTFDWSLSKEGSINLSEKTRSLFILSLRKLSEPMSLAEMAMTWDNCARTVLLECAQSIGGGCFSSRYGKWENCLTA